MKHKKRLQRIILGGVVFVAALFIPKTVPYLQLLLYFISYFVVGGDVLIKAFKNILNGHMFDENFLMGVATIGAFCIKEYPEAVAVMLFYQVGELFQSYAVDQSRKSIAELMDIRPDYANVQRKGKIVKINPNEVQIGDEIIIKAGERIPIDSVVIEGSSMVDTSALTGESVPREVSKGSELLSGCINVNGMIIARVTKEYGDSTVSKVLDLVENASGKKSNSENFITKFARYYTPFVVISAIILAILPPMLIHDASFSEWIYRAFTFLVISCPCALVISIPLSFFGGIGGASKSGVLVKGSNYLEALAKTEIVVFDKTGTLTKGVFKVQEIHAEGLKKHELLKLTAYAESYSTHPISISLKQAYGKEIDNSIISNVEEIPGHGVFASINGNKVLAGNSKLMQKMDIPYFEGAVIGTVVHVAVNGKYAGYIVIADEIKNDSPSAIKDLKQMNIKNTVMLTGDSKVVGENVAKKLGLDMVYTELLPVDKVKKVEELFYQKSDNGKLAFVGDGINDAPVLARADIGIAMGGLGSDAAIEAADIVIMTDEPSKIATAMRISKRTLRIVRQNIVFALGVKALVLILGALGIANMWIAVFADVGVSVIAILNAMRVLNVKKFV
ncbi:cadmium-translocating P-type ATPase [Clostridium botulinum]|uniref:Cadmium-translocating P-type ATPase n=1 Tax=Clostridium botulinum TaxID=1491 RepID=A0A6B4ZWH3_CLOBO|nr:cadmium-translocating P-type ATPase [Clostridium botulinum]NFD85783.1 cadmium-translocating P-type ATPase [Clostridium botulinum]NFE07260.1 cadmium-translocating P-type ATPase [Clostridium botulinum]NFE35441.1 cadmium-translocating P-type ATPase [Clostridium botulinum]NFE49714.1 cadmium-translocating P-type ATPase [Clostridium botulinum]